MATYPKQVTINGKIYTVHTDHNSSGEIQYFQLRDTNGDFFYEIDWEGYLTKSDILTRYQEDNELVEPKKNTDNKQDTPAGSFGRAIESISEEVKEITFFDKMYPHYASCPPEFSNESTVFKNILLDELSDEYWELRK